jgi:iron complex transport system ATP-binding protein
MSESQNYALRCKELSVSVPGRMLVADLNLEFAPGEFLAVLGQNGSGKTLTLHTLAGLRQATSGSVTLMGKPIEAMPRSAIAQRLALLPQHTEDIFPSTVLDTVLIGRHPHIERFQWESDEDRQRARSALCDVDMESFADRDLDTLSGGERRRVAIAQVLTHDPDIYVLDEPGNHLDPQHQLDTLQLFRRLSRSGKTIIASLHDANLAMRFADRCLLMHGDGRWQLGESAIILNDSNLSDLYSMNIETVTWRDKPLFVAAGSEHQDDPRGTCD